MKKILSRMIAIIMTMALVTGAFAGTAFGAAATEETEERALTIGLALPSLTTNTTFIAMQEAIQAKCDEKGYTLMPVDTQDVTALVQALENFISAKCDVVILSNFGEEAYADLLQQLLDQGCVLGSYDYTSEYAQYAIYASNYEMGHLIGEEAGKWCNEHEGSKKMGIITVSSLDFLVTRTEGIKDGFRETCPDGEIVSEQSALTTADSVERAESILQTASDVQVIATIGDFAALGAYEACKAAGKSFEKDGIAIFGVDGSADGLNAIRENDMFVCSIYLDLTDQMVGLFERCCETALTGVVDEEMAEVPYPCTPIYLDNIDEAQ